MHICSQGLVFAFATQKGPSFWNGCCLVGTADHKEPGTARIPPCSIVFAYDHAPRGTCPIEVLNPHHHARRNQAALTPLFLVPCLSASALQPAWMPPLGSAELAFGNAPCLPAPVQVKVCRAQMVQNTGRRIRPQKIKMDSGAFSHSWYAQPCPFVYKYSISRPLFREKGMRPCTRCILKAKKRCILLKHLQKMCQCPPAPTSPGTTEAACLCSPAAASNL